MRPRDEPKAVCDTDFVLSRVKLVRYAAEWARATLMPEQERRSYNRYVLWFPVTLMTPAGRVGAICRDASGGGLLVSAQMDLSEGMPLTATFRLPPMLSHEVACHARVVRSTKNSDDLELVFPFRVAIEFEAPHPEIEELLRNAEHHARPD